MSLNDLNLNGADHRALRNAAIMPQEPCTAVVEWVGELKRYEEERITQRRNLHVATSGHNTPVAAKLLPLVNALDKAINHLKKSINEQCRIYELAEPYTLERVFPAKATRNFPVNMAG